MRRADSRASSIGGNQRWAAAATTHRRLTILLGGILLIWLMVIIRYYYYYGNYSSLPSVVYPRSGGHGLDPHPPHSGDHGSATSLPAVRDDSPPSDELFHPPASSPIESASPSSLSSPSGRQTPEGGSSSVSSIGGAGGVDSVDLPQVTTDGRERDRYRMSSPAIVIIAHDRDVNIRSLYDTLITQPNVEQFQIYISCDYPAARHKITSALPTSANVTYWWHQPYAAEGQFADWQRSGLFRISYHFKVALTKVFDELHHSHAIFIEEDLVLAPDFLQLFIDTAWLLDADPSLYCVSAWNDNGMRGMTSDYERLFRTGYFPGLGWMIKQDMWNEHLRDSWPTAATTGWDHWIRLSSISHHRECISPEIPRTQHTSEKGINVNSVSAALFAKYAFSDRQPKHDGTSFGDTRRLLEKPYSDSMKMMIQSANRIQTINDINSKSSAGVYVLPYRGEDYLQLSSSLGLWSDHGARGWYHGIITTRLSGRSDIIILLADRRRAIGYLNDDEIITGRHDTVLVGARSGENCVAACSRSAVSANMKQKRPSVANNNPPRQLRCYDSEITFANTCEALQSVFACEGGCGHQIGAELPAYVTDVNERTYHQCLVTDGDRNTCQFSHPATQRVCPCNPV